MNFVGVVDTQLSDTAWYADVVLPAASFLEKESVRSWWIPLQTINKAISVDGCRSDVEINFELSRRFDPNFRWSTVHELFDDIIKPSGMTFEQLQEGWRVHVKGTVVGTDGSACRVRASEVKVQQN